MCGKSIDDIRKSLQPTPKKEELKKEDSILYPGVEGTPVEQKKMTKKEQKKTLDEIHAFVDKL